MTNHQQMFATHLAALSSISSIAINSVILGNSASAGAVLALVGTAWANKEAMRVIAHPAIQSITVFACGVFAAMLSAGLGYLCQYCYAWADLNASAASKDRLYVSGHVLLVAAVILCFLGMTAFAIGAWHGVASLARGIAPLMAPGS